MKLARLSFGKDLKILRKKEKSLIEGETSTTVVISTIDSLDNS